MTKGDVDVFASFAFCSSWTLSSAVWKWCVGSGGACQNPAEKCQNRHCTCRFYHGYDVRSTSVLFRLLQILFIHILL